ncbi:hypothetical protein [Clostridium sp. VAP52]|uniref:hypothetical protein n=1 Tax=Clostridium sp. VAP52 TaxID=2949977 RepID=UPI002079C92D|nr:hypothetical protein [Clostridium sp. VAP52]
MIVIKDKNNNTKRGYISATDIQLLDEKDKYERKILEDAMQELGSGTEHNMLRIEGKVDKLEEDKTNILKVIGNVNVETDEDIASQLKENTQHLSQISNPNLLINGDFQVWQRGEGFDYIGSIDGKKNIYTADRWRIVQSHDTPKCNIYKYKDGNGVYFGLNNLYKPQDVAMAIHQKLEPFYLVSGKYTLSFEYANTGNVEFNARVYSFKKNQNIECSERCIPNHSETWSKCKMTFDIDNTNIQDVVEISFDLFGDYNNDGIFYLRRVKLELGSVATPFVPRSYGEEVVLCQRYYFPINPTQRCRSIMVNNNVIMCELPVPTTMRINPTLVKNPNVDDNRNIEVARLDGTLETGFAITYDLVANAIRVKATKNAHGLTDATINFNNKGFDSEIY